MEQRTLDVNGTMVYCYEDGSVEFFSRSSRCYGLHRTLGNVSGGGYRRVKIERHSYSVHRLIALAFYPNHENKPEVDHINRDVSDNRPENLRWVTRQENSTNRLCVDISLEKYGVRECENQSEYTKSYNKEYNRTHVSLRAIQPNGKPTTYHFDPSNPAYEILKPLKPKERYYAYKEIRDNGNRN